MAGRALSPPRLPILRSRPRTRRLRFGDGGLLGLFLRRLADVARGNATSFAMLAFRNDVWSAAPTMIGGVCRHSSMLEHRTEDRSGASIGACALLGRRASTSRQSEEGCKPLTLPVT